MEMCLCCGTTATRHFRSFEHANGEMILCVAEKECTKIEDGEYISSVVDIDEMLVDTIRVLRQNNFKTLFCCQGHYYGGNGGLFEGNEGYISFEIEEKNKEDFKKYDALIKSIPNNIGNFKMEYEIVKGPRGPGILDRNILIEKLVLRFNFNKNVEILTHLDFLEQNLNMHKQLFFRILDMLEEMEEEKQQESLPDNEKSITYAR